MKILIIISILLTGCYVKKETDQGDTRSALSVQEDHSNEIDTAALAMAADLYYQNNKYREAVDAYNKLIKIDSLNGRFYGRRAYSLCQINMASSAIEDYLKAAKLGHDKLNCYYSLGVIFYGFDNDSLAVKYFEKCVDLDPNSAEARQFLTLIKKTISL